MAEVALQGDQTLPELKANAKKAMAQLDGSCGSDVTALRAGSFDLREVGIERANARPK